MKKQRLTAVSTHSLKIDGFDIISTASLSHMPAMEGQDEINHPLTSIPTLAVTEQVVFYQCVKPFFTTALYY